MTRRRTIGEQKAPDPASAPNDGKHNRVVYEFIEDASRPDVDRGVVDGTQFYSPIVESNAAIRDALAQEFLPLFADAISPVDWLWEPEIAAEIDTQIQALVKGGTDARASANAVQAVAAELRAAGRSYFP